MQKNLTENEFIEIKGARVHNLKNISLKIPRNKLIVITGLSGSGKSSLAFDTLYAEGQRRYVESLSSYARQFLGRINKPDIDFIKGIPPAIAIQQKVNTRNPRSTVGTSTEIYDYLKLLYARIGNTFSPITGKMVKKHSVTDVVNTIAELESDTKILVLFPFKANHSRSLAENLDILMKQGYSRVWIDNTIYKMEEINSLIEQSGLKNTMVVVDRIIVDKEPSTLSRLADSAQSAFYEGHGTCFIKILDSDSKMMEFSNRYESEGVNFEEPTEWMFSFNNPIGACPVCEGFGQTIGIDEDLVIPNKNLSIYEEAIACWKGEKMGEWKDKLILNASKFDFPVHKPYFELNEDQKLLLWTGNKHFNGLNEFFQMLEENTYKIQYRVMLSRYRGKTVCPQCKGTRLKKEASYVKVANKSIQELVVLPISDLHTFFNHIKLKEYEKKVASRIVLEIINRLQYLMDVGLGYLNLNRLSASLSGGESQRINLATSLGSSLVGSLYILDEPSIGLHPRDTQQLLKVLLQLRDLGNTIVVVEHDEEIMKAADHIIDIGPLAGQLGGEIVFEGKHNDLIHSNNSLTAKYLTGREKIEIPYSRRNWNHKIDITSARENNLKGIDVVFPLNVLTVITGVSGSGKSSLVSKILYPALKKHYGGYSDKTGQFGQLSGDLNALKDVEFIDQNPIGKSTRSNPVTYSKAYEDIRKLYSDQQLSVQNGFTPGHFSFNTEGGRCDECQGEGLIRVEMQFMADVELICESCKGKRFKDEILEVKYKNKSIFDILELTIDEAIDFFLTEKSSAGKKIISKLQPLADTGLGYVKLGQSSSTLSGGESQRIKLASFLGKEKSLTPTLFIFDEPTTGLHFHDIKKLLRAFDALILNGHSILVIEHNPEVIKCADWIIDLGPDGGNNGGTLVFAGTPENMLSCNQSYTARFLKDKLLI